jgi:D-galactarolactone cycloisomerase
VAELLGGAVRNRVAAYAAGPYFKPNGDPYREYAREAEAYVRAGFRAVKAKVGRSPRADAAALAAVRSAVGADVALMVDANQGCTPATALATARRLVEHDIVWFEEPVPPESVHGYRAFAQRSPIPASGGEALGELSAFDALLRAGVDVVQPDLSICGGFAAALEVTTLAQVAGAAVVPHVWGTGINLHASLQLAAVLPSTASTAAQPYPWLEMDRSPNPLRMLWGEPTPGGDGTVAIPDGPGIGIDINAADLARYTVDHWSIEA